MLFHPSMPNMFSILHKLPKFQQAPENQTALEIESLNMFAVSASVENVRRSELYKRYSLNIIQKIENIQNNILRIFMIY